MSGYQDALSNIMPVDWLDPYGRTPFAQGAEMSVDITIVETEDGIRATSVKNPPRAGSDRLMNAIKNALGLGFMDSPELCGTDEKKNVPQEEKDDSENVNQKKTQRQSNVSENSSDVLSDDEKDAKEDDEDDRDR